MAAPGVGGGSPGALVRQGYLRKLKTMKRRFFVLRADAPTCSTRLEYYDSEKKFRSGAAPKRVLPLKSCFDIAQRLDMKQKYVIALYTKEEQFCVVPEDEKDLNSWLADLKRHYMGGDVNEELLNPVQLVWQVNVHKRGLGASKNIVGLYNLCLTDKALTLVKIKANNNIIEHVIQDRIEYTLKNIRTCGYSESFFYMEVGRQTSTGAGELWMHAGDANISQCMHTTIYHAMSSCKDIEPRHRNRSASTNEDPRSAGGPAAARQSYSDATRGRAGGTPVASVDKSPNNSLMHIETKPEGKENARVTTHQRTASLPAGCPLFHEPLKIVHERTRSAPLTGDEVNLTIDKPVRHSSCKVVNGFDNILPKRQQWSRRSSIGTRMPKISPVHIKNAPVRNRCDSMPSRTCPPMDQDRAPSRYPSDHIDVSEISRDEPDSIVADWLRTPRIPEEADYCIMTSLNASTLTERYALTAATPHDTAASSDSVCSGTPSTDPRFSEYQLEPATAHILDEAERHPRAYSVGSRPAFKAAAEAARMRAYSVGARSRGRPALHGTSHSVGAPIAGVGSYSAPQLPPPDLMELDFSHTMHQHEMKQMLSRTPPSFSTPLPKSARAKQVDEYVDMSPRSSTLAEPRTSGYVEMKPTEGISVPLAKSPPPRMSLSKSPPTNVATTPDGYVEMNYGKRPDRTPSRPITIVARTDRQITSTPIAMPTQQTPVTPEDRKHKLFKEIATPSGSQIFAMSFDSPVSPRKTDDKYVPLQKTDYKYVHDLEPAELFEDLPHHSLTTVTEISEDCGRKSPEVGSPSYITLARPTSQPIDAPPKLSSESDELSCNPSAIKWASRGKGAVRLNAEERQSSSPVTTEEVPKMIYADLDLDQQRLSTGTHVPIAYSKIDFVRSDKNTADAN